MAYAAHQETELKGAGLSDKAIFGAFSGGLDFSIIIQIVKLIWSIRNSPAGQELWDLMVRWLEGMAPKTE